MLPAAGAGSLTGCLCPFLLLTPGQTNPAPAAWEIQGGDFPSSKWTAGSYAFSKDPNTWSKAKEEGGVGFEKKKAKAGVCDSRQCACWNNALFILGSSSVQDNSMHNVHQN